ncbi:hypothetical protein BDB01DRAFT_839376 [Pilobolus umbonatus]|nr:hypothetical protein BDB01DRAFT_839376 [Pilobolus umbonatus]
MPICPYALMPLLVGWLVEAGWFFICPKIAHTAQDIKLSLVCHIFSYGNNHSSMNCIIHLIFDGLSTAGSNNARTSFSRYLSTWGQKHLYMVSRASLLDGKNISTRDKIIFTWGQELIYLGVQSQLFCEIKHIFLLGEVFCCSYAISSLYSHAEACVLLFSDRSFIVSGKYKITREQEPSFIFNERNVIGSSLYELEYQITGSNCSQIPLEDELGCARLCEGVYISHSGRATSDAMAGNSSSTTGLSLGCLGTPGTFLPLLGFLFGTVDLARLQAFGYRISKLLKRNIGISQVQIAFFQVTRSPPQYA